jgi:hypothetical protein
MVTISGQTWLLVMEFSRTKNFKMKQKLTVDLNFSNCRWDLLGVMSVNVKNDYPQLNLQREIPQIARPIDMVDADLNKRN